MVTTSPFVRTSNGVLLRTDITGLQQALINCRTLANRLLAQHENLPDAVVSGLAEIADSARRAVFIVGQEKRDLELQLSLEEAAEKTTTH